MAEELRRLEIGGGRVTGDLADAGLLLTIPAGCTSYCDAQIDDYVGRRRRRYPWRPGTHLSLEARFEPGPDAFQGTAGFGFWNAPFGDPTIPWPALPRAVWFFYGSPPNDFPIAPAGPGRGWFAGTVDATSRRALRLAPLALPTLFLNRVTGFRRHLWPRIQARLGMSFQPLEHDWSEWHHYEMSWRLEGCEFRVDGETVLATPQAPRGAMGFVCWVDNQYLALSPTGRLRAGRLTPTQTQTLAIRRLNVRTNSGGKLRSTPL